MRKFSPLIYKVLASCVLLMILTVLIGSRKLEKLPGSLLGQWSGQSHPNAIFEGQGLYEASISGDSILVRSVGADRWKLQCEAIDMYTDILRVLPGSEVTLVCDPDQVQDWHRMSGCREAKFHRRVFHLKLNPPREAYVASQMWQELMITFSTIAICDGRQQDFSDEFFFMRRVE